jgi:hypothetical protein
MAEITLAKALKVKNRLAGRLAKAQADIQAFNSVPEGQADQVNVPALMQAPEELVEALVSLKAAINEANREAQRDIYLLAEKKATVLLAALPQAHLRLALLHRHRRIDPDLPAVGPEAIPLKAPAARRKLQASRHLREIARRPGHDAPQDL